MGRRKCRRLPPEVFNALRIEEWQLDIRHGDRFIVMARPGVVVWGEVVAQAHSLDGKLAWHATLYSEAAPEGVSDIVHVDQMHLPVTDQQFKAAKRMKWPSAMPAVRAIVSMTMPGSA